MMRLSKIQVFALSALAVLVFQAPSVRSQQGSRPAPKVVGTIQGTPIMEEELLKAAAAEIERLELQKQQFEANYARSRQQVMEQNLERLMEAKLLEVAAAKKGMTVQALLAQEVESKIKEPTPEEVNTFYEANKQRISKPKEEMITPIQLLLKQQSRDKLKADFLRQLRTEYKVVSLLEPLRAQVAAAGFPTRGPAAAPVTMVEFSDFECGFCRTFAATLAQAEREFPKEVRLVYRQFPLTAIHPQAQKAAEASLCAEEQGRFWEMHDLMFQEQSSLSPDDLKAKAVKLKMDGAAFNACLDSGKYAERIKSDIRDGTLAGVTGTPALFINGRLISGAQPYAEVARVISNELERSKR